MISCSVISIEHHDDTHSAIGFWFGSRASSFCWFRCFDWECVQRGLLPEIVKTIFNKIDIHRGPNIYLDKVASVGANTLNFTDLGSPYEGPPGTPHSGIMDTPDASHTPKYMDGGAAAAPGKSAFVELQQHGLVSSTSFWHTHQPTNQPSLNWRYPILN